MSAVWKQIGEDDRAVEVILDPDFRGNLIEIARSHTVWIIESEVKTPLIDAAWATDGELGFCEINRAGDSRDLISLLPTLHSHYNWSSPRWESLIVRGLEPSPALIASLDGYGFRLREVLADRFVLSVPAIDDNTWEFGGLYSTTGR